MAGLSTVQVTIAEGESISGPFSTQGFDFIYVFTDDAWTQNCIAVDAALDIYAPTWSPHVGPNTPSDPVPGPGVVMLSEYCIKLPYLRIKSVDADGNEEVQASETVLTIFRVKVP